MPTPRLRHPFPLSSVAMAALALALAGCFNAEDDPAAPVILPLATGNTWAYLDSVYENGALARLDSGRVSITGTRTVHLAAGPRRVHLWNVHRADGTPGALSLWLENRADGNHTVGAQQDTASFVFETLHVKYPAAPGERYPIHFLSFHAVGDGTEARLAPVIDTLGAVVVSASETCATPAGTFPCVHYRGLRGDSVFADTWYAPGVGWVGSETVRTHHDTGTPVTVRTRRILCTYTLYLHILSAPDTRNTGFFRLSAPFSSMARPWAASPRPRDGLPCRAC